MTTAYVIFSYVVMYFQCRKYITKGGDRSLTAMCWILAPFSVWAFIIHFLAKCMEEALEALSNFLWR